MGKTTVEVKSKTPAGVTFTPTATKSGDSVSGTLKAAYGLPYGIDSEATFGTNGSVSVSLEGSPYKGLTCTAECDRADMASAFENRADAAFAIILDHNKTRVRYWYRFDPFESYAANMHLTMRLVLSLKEAGTTLPILLLPSGGRHEGYEAALTREGVTVVPDALDGAVFAPR